jgi:hypothetical protein
MNNRKYIREEGINSRTDGKGRIFAHEILGANTRVHFTDRQQGPDSYNGQKFNRIIYTIEFTDFNCGMTTKHKDCYGHEEALLVQYALDLMENETLEEYYKAVLLLTKISLEQQTKDTDALLAKYDAGKHAWPIESKKDAIQRRKSNERWKKVLSTLDITKNDLTFFEQYEREGVDYSETRFSY